MEGTYPGSGEPPTEETPPPAAPGEGAPTPEQQENAPPTERDEAPEEPAAGDQGE